MKGSPFPFTLVHSTLESFASGEANDPALGDFDLGTRLRVASDARFPLRRLECAEPDECDGLTLLQRLRDAVEERLDRRRRIRLRDARVLRDLCDEVLLVHERLPVDKDSRTQGLRLRSGSS